MRLCAGGTAAQKVEKQHDQADYQDDVNEAGGYVKSEKPQQPKNDQNCGDYPEHFLFLLASRRERVRELVLANPVRGACGAEELRTVIRIVDVGAQDCLVVDTFGFSFLIWGFALLYFARGVHGKENRGPVLHCAGPRRDFVGSGSRDYALVGKLWFRVAIIPTASRPSVRSGSAPGSGTFTGGPSGSLLLALYLSLPLPPRLRSGSFPKKPKREPSAVKTEEAGSLELNSVGLPESTPDFDSVASSVPRTVELSERLAAKAPPD